MVKGDVVNVEIGILNYQKTIEKNLIVSMLLPTKSINFIINFNLGLNYICEF